MATYTAGKPEAAPEFFVEPGTYKLRVVDAEEDTSKSGNEMIKLTQRVILKDGTNGPKLYDYLVFAKSSSWKVDAFLKSAGQHPGEGVTIEIDADDLIDLETEATLTVEEYNGKKSNKVESYLFDEF